MAESERPQRDATEQRHCVSHTQLRTMGDIDRRHIHRHRPDHRREQAKGEQGLTDQDIVERDVGPGDDTRPEVGGLSNGFGGT